MLIYERSLVPFVYVYNFILYSFHKEGWTAWWSIYLVYGGGDPIVYRSTDERTTLFSTDNGLGICPDMPKNIQKLKNHPTVFNIWEQVHNQKKEPSKQKIIAYMLYVIIYILLPLTSSKLTTIEKREKKESTEPDAPGRSAVVRTTSYNFY